CVGEAPQAQIAAQVADVTPQIGAVTSDIEAIGADIASIGPNVWAVSVSIPTGRGDRRGQSGAADRDCSREYQDHVANHDKSSCYVPQVHPAPLKRMAREPRVCRGFTFGLCTLSFGNVRNGCRAFSR